MPGIFQNGGDTERRAGSRRPPITNSREDRHVTRITLMNRAATSRTLSQELGSFARQQVHVRTDRRQHQDSRIRVSQHLSERTQAACILHRYTGSSPGVIVWGTIGYTSRSPLVRIDDTLNSARCIANVLRPVDLPFIRAQRNNTF
ncbi:uncharacterized protein TNCV_2589581 [Trichonephila clavipes]|nr:uncharacterized protein TNCV_2589581 [Trichonephila clavipes]